MTPCDVNGSEVHLGQIVWLSVDGGACELGQVCQIANEGEVNVLRVKGSDRWAHADELEIVDLADLNDMLNAEEEPISAPLIEIHIHDQTG